MSDPRKWNENDDSFWAAAYETVPPVLPTSNTPSSHFPSENSPFPVIRLGSPARKSSQGTRKPAQGTSSDQASSLIVNAPKAKIVPGASLSSNTHKSNRFTAALLPKAAASHPKASTIYEPVRTGEFFIRRQKDDDENSCSISAPRVYGSRIHFSDIQGAHAEFNLGDTGQQGQNKKSTNLLAPLHAPLKRLYSETETETEQAVTDKVSSWVNSNNAAVQRAGSSSSSASATTAAATSESDIFSLYGILPGIAEQQKQQSLGSTEDRIMVGRIYLGIYGFHSEGFNPLYVRVDGGVNQCILLGLNDNTSGTGEEVLVLEEVPLDKIEKIVCGRCSYTVHGHEAYVVLVVKASLVLNSTGVGPNCMLCPTLVKNSSESGKYILIMCSNKALEAFKSHVMRVQFAQQMENILIVLERPTRSELDEYLHAHIIQDSHSRSELQARAAEERERKQKAERRRNRSLKNNSVAAAAAVDPATEFVPLPRTERTAAVRAVTITSPQTPAPNYATTHTTTATSSHSATAGPAGCLQSAALVIGNCDREESRLRRQLQTLFERRRAALDSGYAADSPMIAKIDSSAMKVQDRLAELEDV